MNKNSEVQGMIFVMAIVAAAFFLIAAAVFALFVFAAIILSIVCLFAWNKPLTLWGDTLEPEDARAFVLRGFAGAMLLPAFVLFCALLFDLKLQEGTSIYVALAGYAAGSLGLQILIEKEKEEAAKTAALLPSLPPVIEHSPEPTQPTPQASEERFRFATWDDEFESNKPDEPDRCHGCA